MRLGKTERYILNECFKRYPKPLKKFEVLEDHYHLKRNGSNYIYAKVYFSPKESDRNSVAVRYSKAVGRLKQKGVITIYPQSPNRDCISLTGLGFETVERLTAFGQLSLWK
jgi:hypothetical protein